MLSRNAQIWETNLFNWVFGGSGVFLVLQNSLGFLCRHALFTSGCCCFCVSLRFPCQTFRTSVFVPRSPASNLKTIATKLSFWTVLVHEAEFSWFGRFLLQHVLCKQSKLIYNPSFLWGKFWKHDIKKVGKCSIPCFYSKNILFPVFSTEPRLGWYFWIFLVWCLVILSLGWWFFGMMTGPSNSRHSKLRV